MQAKGPDEGARPFDRRDRSHSPLESPLMRLTRNLNQLICRVLIGVFLFARLAVGAYACPSLMGAGEATGVAVAIQAPAAMPGCDQMSMQMDKKAPALCAEHCKLGHQSADVTPAPVVLAGVPAVLYVLPPAIEPMPGSGRAYPLADAVLAAPPPHAILHCVQRT